MLKSNISLCVFTAVNFRKYCEFQGEQSPVTQHDPRLHLHQCIMSGLEDQSSQCQKLYIRTICISEALLQSSSSVVSQPYHTCSSKDNYALNLCFLGYKPLDGSVCHTENTTGPDTVTYPRHYKHMQVTFLFLILLLFYFFPYLYKKILIITLKKSA